MREIKKPAFMKEAEKTKSHSILGEMIIFIVLYVISIFVEAMALVPGLLVYGLIHPISAGIEQYNSLLQNTELLVRSGDLHTALFGAAGRSKRNGTRK